MKNVKAIIFDFDDTLQDRQAAYHLYCANFLEEFFPQKTKEEKIKMKHQMEQHVNGGYIKAKKYFAFLVDLWQWENHPDLDLLANHFLNEYGKHVALMPKAVNVVEALMERGYLLGLITNGPSVLQNMKVDTSGMRPLFDEVIVSGDMDFAKPDARIFETMAERLGVNINECVYIGDHPKNDIEGAKSAGMHAIWMNFGTFENQYTGDAPVITQLEEVLDFFQ